MHHEQLVSRKKRIQSDTLVFVLLVFALIAASMLLGYMEHTLKLITGPLQLALFVLLLVVSYILIIRRLTAYQYVLSDTLFTVYRHIGRKRRESEKVPLRAILFMAPYTQAKGERGRENALCVTKKQEAFVIAHEQNGKRQWLIVNIDEPMQALLRQAIHQNKSTSKSAKYEF
ncbi:hypothetical protein LJC07_08385 [Christensenellaceae bacterium OttesenSCG-928-L17]|nr:hypothetical protein [Christensenellaceae bacterium OttesenSCG-928-L17]